MRLTRHCPRQDQRGGRKRHNQNNVQKPSKEQLQLNGEAFTKLYNVNNNNNKNNKQQTTNNNNKQQQPTTTNNKQQTTNNQQQQQEQEQGASSSSSTGQQGYPQRQPQGALPREPPDNEVDGVLRRVAENWLFTQPPRVQDGWHYMDVVELFGKRYRVVMRNHRTSNEKKLPSSSPRSSRQPLGEEIHGDPWKWKTQ